eukprot:XP_002258109.1 hypothetical protein, conserved in Plasmodium species [Plasmodium knowlesi strain H]
MTKINKPPTTSNPNIKLKKPNSKEEEIENETLPLRRYSWITPAQLHIFIFFSFCTFPQDFMQPVKKTVISKNIKVVKKPEEINASPRKSENEGADKDQAKKGVSSTDPKAKSGTTDNKGKSGADSNSQKNGGGNSGETQVGYFSWLWRYFPKKKA